MRYPMIGQPVSPQPPAIVPVDEPALAPPLIGAIWLTAPAAIAWWLRATDIGTLLQYLWAWSVIVPALVLGIGAVVIWIRSRHAGPAGFRRKLWYWVGGIYVIAAIPILVVLL